MGPPRRLPSHVQVLKHKVFGSLVTQRLHDTKHMSDNEGIRVSMKLLFASHFFGCFFLSDVFAHAQRFITVIPQ